MLIGISGKINTGKDTTAEMIAELTPNTLWENRKFADKLKDIVCLLIGCTREQLEDRSFKESPLGKEWELLRETSSYGAPDVIYPVDYKGLAHIAHTHKEVLTPRSILQLLGTEGGRKIIHPNIWVNALMSEYVADYSGAMTAYHYLSETSLKTDPRALEESKKYLKYPNWLITDMRFPNELEAVKSKGGITVRIERPVEFKEGEMTQRSTHESETALDNAEFDYVIMNTGNLGQLKAKVQIMLIQANIL